MTLATTSLDGKRALVTGAQQGIGAATALALAEAGADVALNWFDNRAAAQDTAAEITGLDRTAHLVQGSVAKAEDAHRMVSEASAALGGIDILVNNAGVFPRSDFLELSEAEWNTVLDVNLKGSFLVAQAAARAMIAAESRGAIVNVSSSSVRGHPLGVHYSASKTGIVGLTRAMALALAPHKIRVNAIAPGLTDTAQPRVEFSDADLFAQADDMPLGTIAAPADIADAIVFLASDASRFMTGALIHANGGRYMA